MRVLVTGAAGLVGQNLVPLLKREKGVSILAVDKHPKNSAVFRELHPDVAFVEADVADSGAWEAEAATCDALVMLQAQIGGLNPDEYRRNNIVSTERVLAACRSAKYLCHVSSSVVNSAAVDLYTESKKAQEALVETTSLSHVVLRPTLMFGWFDRKHLGWLKRFMEKTPVFPVPGDGKYLRQPLYAGDFSAIVASCLKHETTGSFNISGLEKIDYIDLMRLVKEVAGTKAAIVNVPFAMFRAMLEAYAVFDRDPPFTVKQLEALATPDVFEVIDWPALFGVEPTPLRAALDRTFNDPVYSKVELAF